MLAADGENLRVRKTDSHYQSSPFPPSGSSGCFLETAKGQEPAPELESRC